mmetsp:Transcript_65133/g.74860  ORF Transcript_65133/g.74860 Transcript_65133/m.74860 type:complete len:282 (+) Transcript_65133:64-909(+)
MLIENQKLGTNQQSTSKDRRKKRWTLKTRQQQMMEMPFPDSTDKLIIIRSSDDGLNFIAPDTFPESLAKRQLPQDQFRQTIAEASKSVTDAWSQRRNQINSSGKHPVTLGCGIFALVLILAFFLGSFATVYYDNEAGVYIGLVCLGLGVFIAIATSVINLMRKVEPSKSFNTAANEALEKFFYAENEIYKNYGMAWRIIRGHYWIELHIDPDFGQIGLGITIRPSFVTREPQQFSELLVEENDKSRTSQKGDYQVLQTDTPKGNTTHFKFEENKVIDTEEN